MADLEYLKARRRAYYLAHREQIIANVKAWQQTNRERVRGYAQKETAKQRRRTRLAQPAERVKATARTRAWIDAHPERAAAARKRLREENRERYNRYVRDWRSRNLDKDRLRHSEKEHRRRALKFGEGFSVDPVDYAAVLSEHGMTCHICGQPIPDGDLHFDHVIPLSKGGPHVAENIKPSHSFCNVSKGNRI